ncbi:hypothetical protein ACDQ55_10125 [Chitinophaga sp. 30R24]|uniref:hypothetical protein n=1 Tax=Chitinophaga sp. 30R24 TaxID=3248838 RepID=UPI003B91E8AC
MKRRFKCLLLLFLPLLAQAHNGAATVKKTIIKEFTVNDNATFSLFNKYGKVIFHAWNKNLIKATITITGFGKSDAQAQSVADLVDIITEQNSNTSVVLRSIYNPSKAGSGWFSWGDKIDSKDYVNIDYDIYLPQSLQKILVDNQFGDVIADKFSFPATLQLNYCTFDIREAADLSLKINYCDKGKIGKAKQVTVNGNYSTLRGEQLGGLDVSSNYSEYVIGKVGSLKIVSNYDDYRIDQADLVNGRSAYSDIRLGELLQSASISITYGDIRIDKTGSGFKQADFQMTYSDLRMNFSHRQPLSISADLVYGSLGTGGLELRNIISNKKNSILNYSALAGGGSESAPYIKIRGTNSDVKLDTY